jgi:hypothetical protein
MFGKLAVQTVKLEWLGSKGDSMLTNSHKGEDLTGIPEEIGCNNVKTVFEPDLIQGNTCCILDKWDLVLNTRSLKLDTTQGPQIRTYR